MRPDAGQHTLILNSHGWIVGPTNSWSLVNPFRNRLPIAHIPLSAKVVFQVVLAGIPLTFFESWRYWLTDWLWWCLKEIPKVIMMYAVVDKCYCYVAWNTHLSCWLLLAVFSGDVCWMCCIGFGGRFGTPMDWLLSIRKNIWASEPMYLCKCIDI